MKTTEEMISVMRSYADGKEIEYHGPVFEKWIDVIGPPVWNWANFDYRVKPEPPQKKIVPYERAEEFLAAQKEHGPYIKDVINGPTYNMPLCITDEMGIYNIIYFSFGPDSETFSMKQLLYDKVMCNDHYVRRFSWQDGTTLGKEVEV